MNTSLTKLTKTVYRFVLSAIMTLSLTLDAESQIQFVKVSPEQGANFEVVQESSIAFSDVDGDGDEDVLITGWSFSSSGVFNFLSNLYINNGGIFTLVEDTPFEGVSWGSVAFSDIDGDGDEDVLITGLPSITSDEPIANLYTNEGGIFTLAENTPFDGVFFSSVAFSDVDGDGDEDLLITGLNGNTEGLAIANLYSNEGGIFTLVENTPFTGLSGGSTSFSDIDGDGDEDLLITGSGGSKVANLYSNDSGIFTLVEDTPFLAVSNGSTSFSDIDGDGDEDVLITGSTQFGGRSSNLYSNEGGIFTLIEDTPFDGVFSSSVAFADVDGDGDEDVLITGSDADQEYVSSLYANEGGTFNLAIDLPPSSAFSSGSVAFSDVDGDGDQDALLTGAFKATLFRNITGECIEPNPAVDESSLNTTFLGDSYLVEWNPVPDQIACQAELYSADGVEINVAGFLDENVGSAIIPGVLLDWGTEYKWRVRCSDCASAPVIAGPFSSFQFFTTPEGQMISSAPNPTEGLSNVSFTVMKEVYTTLEVFDMSGRSIDVIFAGMAQPNADYRFEYDGSALPNGVYLYRLTTENEVVTEKFMIAR